MRLLMQQVSEMDQCLDAVPLKVFTQFVALRVADRVNMKDMRFGIAEFGNPKLREVC